MNLYELFLIAVDRDSVRYPIWHTTHYLTLDLLILILTRLHASGCGVSPLQWLFYSRDFKFWNKYMVSVFVGSLLSSFRIACLKYAHLNTHLQVHPLFQPHRFRENLAWCWRALPFPLTRCWGVACLLLFLFILCYSKLIMVNHLLAIPVLTCAQKLLTVRKTC
jgi:hypothetical protein